MPPICRRAEVREVQQQADKMLQRIRIRIRRIGLSHVRHFWCLNCRLVECGNSCEPHMTARRILRVEDVGEEFEDERFDAKQRGAYNAGVSFHGAP
jgi:hypothetical protein